MPRTILNTACGGILALVIALHSPCSIAADGDDALFGLKWGMSIAEVRALGVPLKKEKGDGNLEIFSSKSMPKELSNAESYALVFADGKLVKQKYIANNITGDAYGTEGKERFESLKAALSEKYGAPSANYQSVGGKLYREADEFYQCLAYDGCGVWSTFFDSPDKSLMLELIGLRRGIGYITLTAEATPQWSAALERRKGIRGKSDKAAL